ncbi:hypothetical protein [Cupriavidus pampae]|uniref:Uncharacterized protein n=1 Tax=Cupriavidus pampae TaxID=659251 RepID=A0ABN7YZ69_9BURK|nr:hypothetical protein [Cupriavidus pampae]CAG9177591.1 hypothetical protein LMG32289_03851 [Cupriavidus pampae]
MRWLWLILVVASAGIGYFSGQEIPLASQWPYFEALRTTSSIVFGVMGALLAIVYPEVVKQGFRAEGLGPGDPGNLRIVVGALAYSALLLLVLVLIGPAFAWISQATEKASFLAQVQGVSFGVLCMLTMGQIWILTNVLHPLDFLVTHLEIGSKKEAAKRRIHQFGPGDKKTGR